MGSASMPTGACLASGARWFTWESGPEFGCKEPLDIFCLSLGIPLMVFIEIAICGCVVTIKTCLDKSPPGVLVFCRRQLPTGLALWSGALPSLLYAAYVPLTNQALAAIGRALSEHSRRDMSFPAHCFPNAKLTSMHFSITIPREPSWK